MKAVFHPLAILMVWLVLTGFSPLKGETPAELYFPSPFSNFKETQGYHNVARFEGNIGALEKSKIEYLLERMRGAKDCAFIRNGTNFDAKRAVFHLKWKYRRSGKIKTAKHFIELLATRSSTTGELYLVRFADGSTFPLRDILINELTRLENSLQDEKANADS